MADTPHRTGRLTPRPPNPTLAAFLGVIPGVGAAYNGQYEKGVVHVLMFPLLIVMTHAEDFFGFLIPVYFAYMVVDAYKTATALLKSEPLPDYLRLRSFFGSSERPISAAFGLEAPETDVTIGNDTANPPLGAILLIVLGVLLLLGNMGWIPRHSLGSYWPAILIVVGLIQARRRTEAPGACACARCRAVQLLPPALFVTFGLLVLLGELHVIGFRRTWPLLLIVIGGLRLVQSTASMANHRVPGDVQDPPMPLSTAPAEVTHE